MYIHKKMFLCMTWIATVNSTSMLSERLEASVQYIMLFAA